MVEQKLARIQHGPEDIFQAGLRIFGLADDRPAASPSPRGVGLRDRQRMYIALDDCRGRFFWSSILLITTPPCEILLCTRRRR